MASVGKKMTLAITAPLIALGVTSIKAAAESKAAIGQVEAALASMGSAAGKTSKQLQDLATGQMRQSLYDDDEILRKVTANLLTFGNIAGTAFDKAQQAALDLSARLGQDLQSSALMVGKALNDPAKGLAALRRVGIQFTEQQQDQIKAMVKVGDLAGAQAVMLKELERQFGGAAKAARDANPMAVLQQSFAEFQETVGEKLLPLLPRITDAITKVLDAFGKLSPGMQEALIITAGLAAAFGPLLIVIGSVTTALAPFVAGIKLATATAVAAGVQVTSLSVALNVLRAAFLTLAATLGPYALALAGVAAIYYALKLRSGEAATATDKYREAQEKANATNEKARGLLAQMATANAKLRQEIIARAKADREAAIQAIAKAKADLLALRAETARLQAFQNASRGLGQADPRTASLMPSAGAGRAIAENNANAAAARRAIADNTEAIATLSAVINSASVPNVSTPSVGATGGGGSGGGGDRSGPSAAEIEARFNDEMIGYTQQALSARGQLATSAEERAELEMRSVEWARRQTLQQIASDTEYNAAQKAELSAAVERIADYERQGIQRQLGLELEQESNDLARIEFDAQREQLALASDIADTQADRKRIAFEILELEQEYRRNQLEMVVASELASDAEKARAQAILDSLSAIEKGERASVGRSNETELEAFLRTGNKSPEQMGEAMTGIGLDGLDRLSDGLSRVLAEAESLSDAFKGMRDVFQSVIQDMLADLIKLQLQKALSGLLGSVLGGIGGGGFGGVSKALGGGGFGALKGFAGGTSFAPGGLALVGERGPELVNLPRGSAVIPNHELRGGGSVFNIHVSGPMSDRDARRTGQQIGSAANQRMAQARKAGIAG